MEDEVIGRRRRRTETIVISDEPKTKEDDMDNLVMLGQAAIGLGVFLAGLEVSLLGTAAVWYVSTHGGEKEAPVKP